MKRGSNSDDSTPKRRKASQVRPVTLLARAKPYSTRHVQYVESPRRVVNSPMPLSAMRNCAAIDARYSTSNAHSSPPISSIFPAQLLLSLLQIPPSLSPRTLNQNGSNLRLPQPHTRCPLPTRFPANTPIRSTVQRISLLKVRYIDQT